MDVIDSLQVHQSEEVPTRKIAAFSYFYDRAVDAGMLQQGESAVVQVPVRYWPEEGGDVSYPLNPPAVTFRLWLQCSKFLSVQFYLLGLWSECESVCRSK